MGGCVCVVFFLVHNKVEFRFNRVCHMPRSLFKLPGTNVDCREVCTNKHSFKIAKLMPQFAFFASDRGHSAESPVLPSGDNNNIMVQLYCNSYFNAANATI